MNVKAGNDQRKALAQKIISQMQNQAVQGPGANALAAVNPGGAMHGASPSGAAGAPGFQHFLTGHGGAPSMTFQPGTAPGLQRQLGPGSFGHAGVGQYSDVYGSPTSDNGGGHGVGNSVAMRVALAAAMAGMVGSGAGVAHGMGVGPGGGGPPGQNPAVQSPGGGYISTVNGVTTSGQGAIPGVSGSVAPNTPAPTPFVSAPGSNMDGGFYQQPDTSQSIHLGNGVYYNPQSDTVHGMPLGGVSQWFR